MENCICDKCFGVGRVGEVKCFTCNETGKIGPVTESVGTGHKSVCHRCLGSGQCTNGREVCPDCNGLGVIYES